MADDHDDVDDDHDDVAVGRRRTIRLTMRPTLFGDASAYPIFVLVAIGVAVATMLSAARREGLSLGRVLAIQSIVALAGVLGAATYNALENGEGLSVRSLVGGGLRYPGGILAVILVLPLVRALLPPPLGLAGYLDLMAPPAAFAMAVMRVGCFMMGCCYGVPSTLPWALRYPPESQAARHHAINGWVTPGDWSLAVHPLHLYLGLASLAVGLVLVWFRPRRAYPGQVCLLFLLLHETAKGTLELLRGGLHDHPVSHLRVVSLGLALLAAIALAALGVRRQRVQSA